MSPERNDGQEHVGPARNNYVGLCRRVHGRCFGCGDAPGGAALHFRVVSRGVVEADVVCSSRFQGYDGLMHGGIISLLLDEAMTHSLLSMGVVAVTAEITVKFRQPIHPGETLQLRGEVTDSFGRLQTTTATLTRDGRMVATAVGKFVAMPVPDC